MASHYNTDHDQAPATSQFWQRRPYTPRQTLETIMQYVAVCPHGTSCPTCCWPWTRCTTKNGYGRVGYHGKTYDAHRLLYELVMGPLHHLYACHTCHNKICVNWHHLYAGTPQDNARDRAKPRHPRRSSPPPQPSTPPLDPRWATLFEWPPQPPAPRDTRWAILFGWDSP